MSNKTTLVPILLAVAALAGCGELGELSGRVEQPQIVTKRQLARYPADSPERTVLLWWRALQFNSPELASRYYSPDLKLTPAELEEQLKLGPDFLDLKAGLRLIDVEEKGSSATILALRDRVLQYPNKRLDRVRVPMAFNLRRESGEWRLANNRYIDRALENAQAFIEQGGKSGK
jgi:hypothetical protein